MKKEEVLQHLTTPLISDPVPNISHKFNNRGYLYIVYKTDRKALEKVVPEPLQLLDEPLVRFEVMYMQDATGFGCYTESGQAIPVIYNGLKGDYLHMMYLDNFEAIAAGKESSAYPKKIGYPSLYIDNNTIVGTLDYGRDKKFRIANATMTYKYKKISDIEAIKQLTAPTYMLKLYPNYDRTLRIAEMTLSQIRESNVKILEAWTGDARLQLFDHVNCPLNDLPVKEIVSCSYIVANVILAQPKPIYDYLK
ncbi:acetoacetate decarboxylase [Megasphaera paucivorans]|uniref:Acetoacetate decarboxylase n=1 Tax=Megasphaera paucivorans TaxID=349095 RepID=A0A1G9YMA9_9FIRM|nr:acetoacetate decarboxylase [Megasphaera paucivorans]SDN10152.1 acetoacetate decarboxylase [Megasphaera paucivorans]